MDTFEAVQYKCPNCDAELNFKPDTQDFACDYCDSHFTEAEIKQICAENEQMKLDKNVVEEKSKFEENTCLYHCASCGAEIMCEETSSALFCYYCHEPIILSGRLSGDYKPDKVIGFSVSHDKAIDDFKKWCGKRLFCPKDFKQKQQLEKMTGLYVPFWVVDCNIDAHYEGLAKKVRSWSSGNYNYTETKEYNVVRSGSIVLEGLPADGSRKIEDALMEAIEPFDYTKSKDFSMSYLSGFFADKYDVDKQGIFPRIKQRATNASKAIIKKSLSQYSYTSPSSEYYNFKKTNWQYMLLPVWFMTYKHGGKMYEFALNGQTGKIAGTPPLDSTKLALFSSAVGVCAALLTFFGCYLFL